jgi:hypothetical protein
MKPDQDSGSVDIGCADIDRYLDAELAPAERRAYRAHLAGCDACQRDLGELMQLAALEPETAEPGDAIPIQRRRRWMVLAGGAAAAAAALLAVWVASSDDRSEVAFAPRSSTRAIEARFTYEPADRHRPYDVERSGTAAAAEIPLSALAALEERGEHRALAAGLALNGAVEQASAALAAAGDDPRAHADRAAIALLRGDPRAALVAADAALVAEPGLAPAMWNRALALRDLGLLLTAARQLEEVAALGEPGWSEEAAQLAADLRARVGRQRGSWERARDEGEAFARSGGEALAGEIVAARPALLIPSVYELARRAEVPADVERVRAAAAAVATGAAAEPVARLISRLAAVDLAARAPLARWYAELERGADPGEHGAELAALRRGGHLDLLFAALVRMSPSPEVLDELDAIAADLDDPWYRSRAAERRGFFLLYESRDYAAAEAVLSAARAPCRDAASIEVRCGRVEELLGTAYQTLGRHEAAEEALASALARAQRIGDFSLERTTLYRLGEASLAAGPGDEAYALGRAFMAEQGARTSQCRNEVFGHAQLAVWLGRARRWTDTASEVEAARLARERCPELPELITLMMAAAEVAAAQSDRRAARTIRRQIVERRASASAAEKMVLDVLDAQLLLLLDRDAGRARLGAIAARGSGDAGDAGAGSVASTAAEALAIDAAERGQWSSALEHAAAMLGVAAPEGCALALVAGPRGVAAAARGPGAAGTFHRLAEGEPLPPGADLAAAAGLTARCDRIDVIAGRGYYGEPALFDAGVAWRFLSPSGAAPEPRAGPTLFIGGIATPPSLGLAPLRSSPVGPADVVLEGAAATPARALAAMRTASIIEIHAHGLIDAAEPGAELLALSAGPEGGYALTAETIGGAELTGAPVVLLAACNAGRARGHRPWGLVESFLRAGARSVIASPRPIGDADAGRFFATVRERIVAGDVPAEALRRARQEIDRPWTRAVVVFE